jgi:hypothetical protein
MIEDLNDKNVVAYMIMSYDNPQCIDMEEFEDDMKIPKYIKRLINRYTTTGELKTRLMLNHIISFYNVFGNEPATRILFLKMDEEDYPILKTFLTYLNRMPNIIEMIRGKVIYDSDILVLDEVVENLREL